MSNVLAVVWLRYHNERSIVAVFSKLGCQLPQKKKKKLSWVVSITYERVWKWWSIHTLNKAGPTNAKKGKKI